MNPFQPIPAAGEASGGRLIEVEFDRKELGRLKRAGAKLGMPVPDLIAAALTAALAKGNLPPPCPFCGKADELQTFWWSYERPDGSEFEGRAMRCLRCDAIAPLPRWLALGKFLQPATDG